MQNKLYVVFGVFCVLFVALIIRLMYIEYTSGDKYEKIVLSQQQYDSTVIPYQRGEILDTNGTVLATCVDVYNVILDCKVLNANEDKIESTIAALERYIPEVDTDEVRSLLEEKPDSQYQILCKQISSAEMQTMQDAMDDEETGSEIAGIWFEKEYVREYPYDSAAASVIGYSTSTTGVIGLELQYDDTLNGTNGRSYGYVNSDSDVEQTLVEAVDGNSIVTTLDINIQTIVEEAVLWANEEMANSIEGVEQTTGSENTAVIVMDPNNGEVLAMASYPGFDLNNPKDLSAYYTEEELAVMTEDEQLEILNQIWQNYTITSTFEPGSTYKPFTVAMGLDTGALTGDETFNCTGYRTVSGYDIHCVNRNGHGILTVSGALQNSCNVCLMDMAELIGGSTMSKYMSIYGFGQKTNIDLPGEASTASLIYTEDELNAVASNLAITSFGQGFNVTMIQLASGFCSLINGGDYYQPHVVREIVDSSGNTVEEISSTVIKKTVSSEVSEMLKEYLQAVVEDGTGHYAAVEGYEIGGKTGTAEKRPTSAGNYLVSFIGFAPVDDPEVLVYVVVDTPHVADQSSCHYAQEIAKRIFEQILPYLNVEKTAEETEETDAITEETTTETTTEEATTTEETTTETTEEVTTTEETTTTDSAE